MTRPRDVQKSRVYAAQAGWPHVNTIGSIAETQAWVDAVTGARWFRSRWGERRIEVRFKAWGNATGYHGGHVCLPPWARNDIVVLHEIAHVLTPSRYASHGEEFCAHLVTLVDNHLGGEAGRRLRAAFKAHRVRYRNGFAAVPGAGSTRVVTSAEKAQRQKAAASRISRELTSRERRQHAADVIRAAVAAGSFGPPGRKPRIHALETARRLEQ